MKKKYPILLVLPLFISVVNAQESDSAMIRKIYSQVLTSGKCYSNLDYLSNKIGGRLSGSPQAAAAVKWSEQAMKDAGADNVILQECMVPHWVRGEKEQAKITDSKGKSMEVPVCALGGSVATSAKGINAQVVEVKNFEELEKTGKAGIQGKIVFYNRPMNATEIKTFHAYGNAVDQRWKGASEAVKYGAIGTIVRSMTLAQDNNPHTGVMRYIDSTATKIPACAISTNGADLLSKMLKEDAKLTFYLKMNCATLPDEKSYNVVGEIKGTEYPEEIITVGGHLDSWDTGQGAHDDGAGVVQAIEVIQLFKSLGIKPKRTIRAVAFMNEENGSRGGEKYFELAKKNKEKHFAAIESDAGGFTPRGFNMEASNQVKEKVKSWKYLFAPYGLHDFDGEGGGADIGPLKELGAALFGLGPDSQRYFDYHHTAIDTFDKVNKRELELGAGSMAALIYLIDKYGL